MTQESLVLAQIGCGYWGPNLLRNFSAQKNCWVKFVVDSSADRRAYVEANFSRTQAAESIETVLSDPEIHAVVIATPADSHYQLTKQFLEAGKHVLVEKPLARSTVEADELSELAAKTGKVLMAGHTFLFNPAVRYVKKLLDQGELGQTYYIYSQRLNLGQVRSDVNAWWNLAPHDVSEDKIAIFDKGIDRVPRVGQDMAFDHFSNYQLLHRTGDVLLPKIDFQEPLKFEASHFLDCIRNGTTPLTGPKHARDVVAVLEAVEKSLHSGRSVSL